jgi:hypothetical protein
MREKVNYFLKMVEHQYPDDYDKLNISVSAQSNYQQYRDMDGRMRAEFKYHSPIKYDIDISFPNIGNLYYDISFYIDCVWGGRINVVASFDYFGKNYFSFTL